MRRVRYAVAASLDGLHRAVPFTEYPSELPYNSSALQTARSLPSPQLKRVCFWA